MRMPQCIDHLLIPHTLHYSDEPSACTIIILIQELALFHRAQVLMYSRSATSGKE